MQSFVPGDIEIDTFTISSSKGNIDLAHDNKLTLMSFNIYESAIDHHTYGDVLVLDTNDILGKNNLSGDEKVQISFKAAGAKESANFKFALIQNSDMKHTGSMKGKTYNLRMCSPELLNSQNKSVNKSYNDQTCNIVKDIVENYWDSEKDFEVKQQTQGQQRYIGNSNHPHTVIHQLKNRHVSQNYQEDGSAYSLFETRNDSGDQVIRFTTFKQMMETDSGIGFDYTQDTTVGNKALSSADDYKNIINLNIPSSFFTAYRYGSTSSQSSYNLASGKQQKEDKPFKDFELPTSETPISGAQKQLINEPPKDKKPIRQAIVSPENDTHSTYISQMKPYKEAMKARLTNDRGMMEVNGNPSLKVGHTINLKIPKKADSHNGEMETQITNKVLITRIRHMVKPLGSRPRYTCVVEFIKAGFDQGVQS